MLHWMGLLYRKILRPLLFLQDSEVAHNRTLRLLAWASSAGVVGNHRSQRQSSLSSTVFDLNFPNPVGLAAGMDKHAAAVPVWEAMGFGFCELGGVTWHPQPGNPPPRMFRAIPEQALINRMGFNNPGARQIARQIASWKTRGLWPSHPVGINLGKSKVTPLEEAANDYVQSFRQLSNLADFFVVNVSSPNTPGLRQLQDATALAEIFKALQRSNISQKPLLVKIAPDLSFEAIEEILCLVAEFKLAGIVATNTTITRPETFHLRSAKILEETGGLSGLPLRERSTQIINFLYKASGGRIPIIGVGGIFSADDAWDKIIAGASLIQIYTGLVYEGPGLPCAIVKGLKEKLEKHRLNSITEAIGLAHK